MATAPNPLVTAIQSRLAQMQGGGAPGAPMAPGASGGSDENGVGAQLAQQSSELHGADPGLLMRQVQKIRDAVGVMFIQTFQSMPNAAGHLSKALAPLDRALKEIQNAAQVASAVKPPVGLSLAQQGPGGPAGPSAQTPLT